jgi:hypothetical protein
MSEQGVDELRAGLETLLEKRSAALAERDQAEANAAAARNRTSEIADLESRRRLGSLVARAGDAAPVPPRLRLLPRCGRDQRGPR